MSPGIVGPGDDGVTPLAHEESNALIPCFLHAWSAFAMN
jgi:hypothetical protein